jgi:hypothetical protein
VSLDLLDHIYRNYVFQQTDGTMFEPFSFFLFSCVCCFSNVVCCFANFICLMIVLFCQHLFLSVCCFSGGSRKQVLGSLQGLKKKVFGFGLGLGFVRFGGSRGRSIGETQGCCLCFV